MSTLYKSAIEHPSESTARLAAPAPAPMIAPPNPADPPRQPHPPPPRPVSPKPRPRPFPPQALPTIPLRSVHFWPPTADALTPCGLSQDAPIDLALVGITCPRCLLKLGKAVSLTLTAEERMIAVRVLANDLARLPADYVDHARPVGV